LRQTARALVEALSVGLTGGREKHLTSACILLLPDDYEFEGHDSQRLQLMQVKF
jgi:hypothetical protein